MNLSKQGLFYSSMVAGLVAATSAFALDCSGLPSHEELRSILRANIDPTSDTANGGIGLNLWAVVVNRDSQVCAVVFSGEDRGDQFPGSRVVAAQKANSVNSFSVPGLALSTANLYSAVQPGGSLYDLQHSLPVNPAAVYGDPETFGTENDSMIGEIPGGVNVFGGGLALYNSDGGLVGGLGISGDSACADHNVAWRLRDVLDLNNVPAGVHPNGNDGIIYDITDGVSASGFGHPACGGTEADIGKEIGAN